MDKHVIATINRLLRQFYAQQIQEAEKINYEEMLRAELPNLPPLQRRQAR